MSFDVSQILNLVGQLGGNHQQAAQQLQGVDQVDPQEHAGLLDQLGIDPRRLAGGGYQQHIDDQQQPGFNGYQQDQDYAQQQPTFAGRGGYEGQQGGGFDQQGGGYAGRGGYEGQQGGGGFDQQGGEGVDDRGGSFPRRNDGDRQFEGE